MGISYMPYDNFAELEKKDDVISDGYLVPDVGDEKRDNTLDAHHNEMEADSAAKDDGEEDEVGDDF
jgi:hypothetical protein